tara:strand:- start:119 stop:874 length:756 start_codon:yes stop_codon:yes gene_type:complete
MPINNLTEIVTLTAGGGTFNLDVTSSSSIYIIQGTATLTSNWTIQPTGVNSAGMQYNFKYEANIALGSNSITIFGATMPATLVNKTCEITCYYDGTDWEVNFLPDVLEANIIPYTSINLPLASTMETYSIPLSFETGEQGFQRIFLNRNGGPFVVKSLNLVTTKLIEATDSGIVTFYEVGGSQLDTLKGGSTGMEVIGGTVAGDAWVTTGNTAPDNNLLVTAFAAPTEIKVKTLKTTAGGKCTLYITIEKL